MEKRRKILEDHQKRGKTLVPPFTHMLGVLHEVSWINTIVPEICWIGLIQYQHGHRGVELITSLARIVRSRRPDGSHKIFAAASNYADLATADWAHLREAMASNGDLLRIQESLEPLISLYPECPLGPIFATPPTAPSNTALERMRKLVASLFRRADRDPMMVQATAIWLAFDADVLKVREGLALAHFPEIEHYPETELSKKIGSSIRSSLNMFFGQEQLYSPDSLWPRYFWNRGLALTPCELADE